MKSQKKSTTSFDDECEIEDESNRDTTIPPIQYDISSHGADYDVEGLVNRLNRGDIVIPPFQRNYVWNLLEASRFIESLLLGLPIPAIFLARESDTNKLLVIDGQQRLKTLQFYYNGYFNPNENEDKQQVFKLIKVQEIFEGLTFKDLEEKDKIKLNDSLIHAIIVRQESPKDDNTSIYHIFERLNSEGRSLTPQEIRTAIDHGDFIDMIKEINEYENWRKIYGIKSCRLKDQELILRFLAFFYSGTKYTKPMQEFLNIFSRKHKKSSHQFLTECKDTFINIIDLVWDSVGDKSFRLVRGINAAVFDSVMVGLANRLKKGPITNKRKIKRCYDELLRDDEYLQLVSKSTSDENNVSLRLKKAIEKFKLI